MRAKQRSHWRGTLKELLSVYTLLQYARRPEALEREFPRDKVQAMMGVYEELSGTTRVEVAQEIMQDMHLTGRVIADKDGNLFVENSEVKPK
jgi:hypothetical protein